MSGMDWVQVGFLVIFVGGSLAGFIWVAMKEE